MVKTPLYPLYSTVDELLKVLVGESVQQFNQMWDTVWNLRGTPQNTVDWTDPDTWISQRLTGEDKAIAERIWLKSKKKVNPRWTRGARFLINGYGLVTETSGRFELSARGKIFVSGIDNSVRQEIDESEGLLQLLYQASIIRNGKRSDFINDWKQYLDNHSNVKQESVVKDYMRRRLVNLADRGYLERTGVFYEITNAGLAYLKKVSPEAIDSTVSYLDSINSEIEKFNKAQKQHIRAMLEKISSVQFEHLIRDLLTSMNYNDIQVTAPTNDKGVDVTATIQHGITSVKEAIQVKRFTKGNVSRTVLDQLRGSLHRFDALQGTIITLSDFAKGAKDAAFEKGVAPITLIDGNKLIDLLVENELLVEKKQFDYYIIKSNYFDDNISDDSEIE